MATKCIDQMPPPNAMAAPQSQTSRWLPLDVRIRPARLSEAKEAKVAMTQDRATSRRSYCPCRIRSAVGGKIGVPWIRIRTDFNRLDINELSPLLRVCSR